MSELVLLLLRLGFLVLLWGFVFAVIFAVRRDLFGRRGSKDAAVSAPPAPVARVSFAEPSRTPVPGLEAQASRLVLTGGPNAGNEVRLRGDTLSIGRASDSDLLIQDDYTSTHHARLLLWNGSWMLQDLDSTNGTFLDGQRVSVPVPIPLNTPVTIGQTSFELRS